MKKAITSSAFWNSQSVVEAFDKQGCGVPNERFASFCSRLVKTTGTSRPRVLDVGCGTGVLSVHLPRLARGRYVGIDPSLEMIARARRYFPRRTFIEGSVLQLPELVRTTFDLVFLLNCLQYLERSKVSLALALVRERMRKGAVAHLQLSHGEGTHRIRMGGREVETHSWTPELLIHKTRQEGYALEDFHLLGYHSDCLYGSYFLRAV